MISLTKNKPTHNFRGKTEKIKQRQTDANPSKALPYVKPLMGGIPDGLTKPKGLLLIARPTRADLYGHESESYPFNHSVIIKKT